MSRFVEGDGSFVYAAPSIRKFEDARQFSARRMCMSVTIRVQTLTRDQFFDGAEAQTARYEFDGFQPVAMMGGSLNHNRLAYNIQAALRSRLKGSGCEAFGSMSASQRLVIRSGIPMGLSHARRPMA